MADTIKFGTDGWRGVMARDFTFDNVRRVAQAISDYVHNPVAAGDSSAEPSHGHKKDSEPGRGLLNAPIAIGYDRRFQSENFAREIARILNGNRLKVYLSDSPLPTPAISFLTQRLKGLGIMVTASHNPPSYNGVKIKWGGRAVLEKVTTTVESRIPVNVPVVTNHVPPLKEKSFEDAYLTYLKSKVNAPRISSRLKHKAVLDYMHGAAGGLLERIVRSKNLIVMHEKRDPLFGGVNPEPIEKNLSELRERVKKEKASIGIALDGDADRIGIVDGQGRYFTPCQVFPILIEHLMASRKLSGKIVQSVSMGYLPKRIARAKGLPFEELPVGFKFVAEQLARGEAAFGGEESGGYSWKGVLPERDGLLAALMFLEMVTSTGKSVADLWKDVETKYGKSFFKRVDFHLHKPFGDKAAFVAKMTKKLPKKIVGSPIKELISIDGLKIILDNDHWLLMRPSGTEPLLRVYAESDSSQRTDLLIETAKKFVQSSLA